MGGSRHISHRVKQMLEYAFVDIVKDIEPWLILVIALAALVVVVALAGKFVGAHLGGGWGISSASGLA
jgi:hypothetical protein